MYPHSLSVSPTRSGDGIDRNQGAETVLNLCLGPQRSRQEVKPGSSVPHWEGFWHNARLAPSPWLLR